MNLKRKGFTGYNVKSTFKKKYIHDTKEENENLSGLLSSYKKYNCYLRIMYNEELKRVSLQMTENPKYWKNIPEEKYSDYTRMKRVKLQVRTLSVKYIAPEHIVNYLGPTLGIDMALRNVDINDYLESEEKYFAIDTPQKYLSEMIVTLKKIINLTPQLKYEMIVKYFSMRS